MIPKTLNLSRIFELRICLISIPIHFLEFLVNRYVDSPLSRESVEEKATIERLGTSYSTTERCQKKRMEQETRQQRSKKPVIMNNGGTPEEHKKD